MVYRFLRTQKGKEAQRSCLSRHFSLFCASFRHRSRPGWVICGRSLDLLAVAIMMGTRPLQPACSLVMTTVFAISFVRPETSISR